MQATPSTSVSPSLSPDAFHPVVPGLSGADLERRDEDRARMPLLPACHERTPTLGSSQEVACLHRLPATLTLSSLRSGKQHHRSHGPPPACRTVPLRVDGPARPGNDLCQGQPAAHVRHRCVAGACGCTSRPLPRAAVAPSAVAWINLSCNTSCSRAWNQAWGLAGECAVPCPPEHPHATTACSSEPALACGCFKNRWRRGPCCSRKQQQRGRFVGIDSTS